MPGPVVADKIRIVWLVDYIHGGAVGNYSTCHANARGSICRSGFNSRQTHILLIYQWSLCGLAVEYS